VNTSATPTLRSEGITEQIGDIVITCTGGALIPNLGAGGGAANPAATQVNITVSLTSQVTSRLLGNAGVGVNASEALLFVDEPQTALNAPVTGFGPNAPFTICTTPTTGCGAFVLTQTGGGNPFQTAVTTSTATQATAVPSANVFQGIVSGNQVTFFGVPIVPPGTNGSRVIRITNVRVNANGIGGGSASGAVPVQASLLTSNFAALPISNATPIVGFVQTGLTTSAGFAAAFGQCVSQGSGILLSTAFANTLSFTENFGTAFKTRVDPTVVGQASGQSNSLVQNKLGTVYNSESGFTLAIGAANAGLADFGTRLKAVFNNLPTGTRIFVSLSNVNATGPVTGPVPAPTPASNQTIPFAQLVTSETAADGTTAPIATASTFTGTGGTPLVEITPSAGSTTATAVWEVINTNPNAIDTLRFGVFIQYTASPGTNSPAPGTATANLSFAPTSTVTSASASAPIPRFIDTSTARNIFSIAICRTVLLFPFVTNQLGFDTGLAISNTSTDPFGTTPQNGTCSLNFYGASAPAAVTTPSIASATSYVNLASVVAPGFQGYMIAVCGFQFAHGFAFVSDVGARNVAMGYLALVIPDPSLVFGGRLSNPFPGAGANTGEQLGY
jgi:hypothetical protein